MKKQFRVTSVGSFPKPLYLLGARKWRKQGKVDESYLRAAEHAATKMWIKFQNELGVDELVHGEMERGDMIAYFAERLNGFVLSEPVESFDNFVYCKPICVGPISPKCEPGFTVPAWKSAQALSKKRPVKGMLTDPFTIAAWSWNEYYVDVDSDGFFRERKADFVRALIPFIRDEARALESAGCGIIQIDCPGIATWPDEFDLLLESMKAITEGLSAKIVCHICFTDFGQLYPRLLELPVSQFLLELSDDGKHARQRVVRSETAFDHFSKRQFTKELGLGVADVHVSRAPSIQSIREIIGSALAAKIAREQILLTPDCGLKTRTVEEAKRIMLNIAKAAKEQ